jgi:hypothetical protein
MGFTHQNAKGKWDHELKHVKIKPAVKFPSFEGACPVQHEGSESGWGVSQKILAMQDLTRSQFSFTFNFLTFILELT